MLAVDATYVRENLAGPAFLLADLIETSHVVPTCECVHMHTGRSKRR